MRIKCYSELIRLPTFEERFEYLKMSGIIGEQTFGSRRELNQALYRSVEWKRIRESVLRRDGACDLGISDQMIFGNYIIHHINPITIKDICDGNDYVFDPEYLICTTHETHNAIHYGDSTLVVNAPVDRKPNDTIPWR